jgi:hypothetical protein
MTEEVVTQPGTRNNGIVEIFDPEAEKKRLEYEAAFINGKRYKVPERIIHLDFWNKIGRSAMCVYADQDQDICISYPLYL